MTMTSATRGLAAAIGVTMLTGCGEGMGLESPIAVAAIVSPAPNVQGVARNAAITMDVPYAMDSTTCGNRMLLHLGDSLGPLIPAHMSFADGYRRMMIQPDSALAPMTTYFVHVRDSMMTAGGTGMMGGDMCGSCRQMMLMEPPVGGVRMGGGMGWSFTTGP